MLILRLTSAGAETAMPDKKSTARTVATPTEEWRLFINPPCRLDVHERFARIGIYTDPMPPVPIGASRRFLHLVSGTHEDSSALATGRADLRVISILQSALGGTGAVLPGR
jgi:hypothetical protein